MPTREIPADKKTKDIPAGFLVRAFLEQRRPVTRAELDALYSWAKRRGVAE